MSRIENIWRQLIRPTRAKTIINEILDSNKGVDQALSARIKYLECNLLAELNNKDHEEIKKTLLSLVLACDNRPIHLNRLIKNVYRQISNGHKSLLDKIIIDVNHDENLFTERKRRSLASSLRLMQRRTIVPNSCDIICKAANEGAYIAEFIHHHLNQGFRNIYIGVNNDSSGPTGKIVVRISKYYPCVHLINTDPDNAKHGSNGTYCRLFEEVSKTSDSSHGLVIDVDETWIAALPHHSISDFISNEKSFDILSLNWINLCGGEPFAKPMEIDSCNASFSKEIKSLFAYNQPILELRDHVPFLENTDNRTIIHRTGDKSHLEAKQISPIYIPRRKLRRQAKPYKTKAWILHRRIRSELEYSSRLFQRKASNSKGSIPFKENRNGYNDHINNSKAKDIAVKICEPNREQTSNIMPPLHEFQQ